MYSVFKNTMKSHIRYTYRLIANNKIYEILNKKDRIHLFVRSKNNGHYKSVSAAKGSLLAKYVIK